jgi:hypothetical protein
VLSAARLDLGATARGGSLSLTNTTAQEQAWSLISPSASLRVSPGAGTLAPGESRTLSLLLNRTGYPEGDLTFALPVRAEPLGTTATVTVTASVEHPPTIGRTWASPATVLACQPTKVTVTVTADDESGFTGSAAWNATGKRVITTMAPIDGGLSAGVGPFPVAGTHVVDITVVDARGNAATSRTTVAVVSCTAVP